MITLINTTLQSREGNDLYMKPIMYGTAIILALVGYFTVAWMYGMNSERDPLIYSKFLSVRKNK